MRNYLNIIFLIFFNVFNVHFSIFNTESLVKMSNSHRFLGSLLCSHLVGPALIILFDCFIDAFEKIITRVRNFFYNHWIWKFPFLVFIFKIY